MFSHKLTEFTRVANVTSDVRDRTHCAINAERIVRATPETRASAHLTIGICAPTRAGALNVAERMMNVLHRQRAAVYSVSAEVHRPQGWGIVLVLQIVLVAAISKSTAPDGASPDKLNLLAQMQSKLRPDSGGIVEHTESITVTLRVRRMHKDETSGYYAEVLTDFCGAAAAAMLGRETTAVTVQTDDDTGFATAQWRHGAFTHGECGLG